MNRMRRRRDEEGLLCFAGDDREVQGQVLLISYPCTEWFPISSDGIGSCDNTWADWKFKKEFSSHDGITKGAQEHVHDHLVIALTRGSKGEGLCIFFIKGHSVLEVALLDSLNCSFHTEWITLDS
jgi:hypothetical protein